LLPGEDKKTVIKNFKQRILIAEKEAQVSVSDDLKYLQSKLTEAKGTLREVEFYLRENHRSDTYEYRTEGFEEWCARKAARLDEVIEQAIQERIQADRTCKGNSTSAFLRGRFDAWFSVLQLFMNF